MIHKHNRRTWKYRALAMTLGYRLRVKRFALPDPNYGLADVPTGAPDDSLIGAVSPLYVGTLIYDDPSNTQECAACGMDASMEHDLELCTGCHKCLHWEDEFGPGACCTCGSFTPVPTDLDPQGMAMEAVS